MPRLPLCSTALLFACLLSANPVAAYCRLTTESPPQTANVGCTEEGLPLFWSNTCLSYAVDMRGSQWMSESEIDAAVELAFEAWENADCGGAPPNIVFQRVGDSVCRRPEFNTEGNVNTVAFLEPWRDPCAGVGESGFEPRSVAVTSVFRNPATGEILDADILINDQLATSQNAGGPFMNCPDTGCPDGFQDLQSILTHEIGHFLGIGHSELAEATMFREIDSMTVDKRTLAPDDIEAVCDIYPPGDLDPLCDPTPIGGLRLDCEIDDLGEPFACDGPGRVPGGGGGGCSVRSAPGSTPWALLLALIGLRATRWSRHE